jgi:hypothetical protein
MRHSHGRWTAPLAVFTTDAKCPHGYSVCPCLLGKPAPEPVAAKAAEVPENWQPIKGAWLSMAQHVSGAAVGLCDRRKTWAWWTAQDVADLNVCLTLKATRAEAMAAALGFEIVNTYGDGFSYLRHDAGGHIQTLRTTAEAAALAACAYDAEQRKAPAVEPVRKAETFAVGDLVRVISTQHAEELLTLGAVHRVTRIDPDYRDEPVITVTGVHSCLAKLFERVSPDEVPPGWVRDLDNDERIADRYTYGPLIIRLNKGAAHWRVYSGARQYNADTLHEACRLARGLERVEQLWEIP